AWHHPAYTQVELPAVDVNKVLTERYSASAPIRLTRAMIWDMELKKAWDPATYIPYVVSEGASWARHQLPEGGERFFRSSIQRAWISEERGRVLEDVFIDHLSQKIIFLGRPKMTDETGQVLRAGKDQPIFHVEHAAGGPEREPLNLWRIIILTESKDQRFNQAIMEVAEKGLLPGFLEIYIERDLQIKLQAHPKLTNV
ncbi:MAG: hypothetical protein ABWY00_08520, partial [Dongiaceae bacterium]